MKKQIDFDFSKWGQEGISVETLNNFEVLCLHKNPKKANYYGVLIDGSIVFNSKEYLKMFEEVKPREFWVNVYSSYDLYCCYPNQEEAESSKSEYNDFQVTIKVREVIE